MKYKKSKRLEDNSTYQDKFNFIVDKITIKHRFNKYFQK